MTRNTSPIASKSVLKTYLMATRMKGVVS